MAEGVERVAKRRVRPVDLESENTETCHTIVTDERLQEKINKSVTCQGSVELVENLRSTVKAYLVHLDVSVPERKLSVTEKSRAFAINRALVLGFQPIGGGHLAAFKVFSFLGLSPNENLKLTNL